MGNPYYIQDQGAGNALFGGFKEGYGLRQQMKQMAMDQALKQEQLKQAQFGGSNTLGATDESLGLPTAGLPKGGSYGPSASVQVPNSIALDIMKSQQARQDAAALRKELALMAQNGVNPKNRLNETALRNLSEARVIPGQLDELDQIVTNQSSLFGPIAGRAQAWNPYDEESRIANSKIKAVAQTVGKYMEGGVLRAEDIPKYAAMLPAVSDTPAIAQGKIANVRKMMQDKYNTDLETYKMGGYDPGSLTPFPVTPQTQDQGGWEVAPNGVKYRQIKR